MPPETPGFLATQQAFTAWVRHPADMPCPTDVSSTRMQVYRDLLFNNVTSFIEVTFPVARALLPSALWQRLTEGFFADHACQSPLFKDISLHFREFVDGLDWSELQVFPWLQELLHVEWMELAADTADIDNPAADGAALHPGLPADSLPLRLGLPVWPLAYRWPVATWTTDSDPAQAVPGAYAVLFWRDADDQVRILPVEPLSAWLVEQMQAGDASLIDLADRLRQATPGLDADTAMTACRRLLQTLADAGLAWLA